MLANFIQSLQKQDFPSHFQRKSFQPGQVFQGKISKLFPNQIAEVQVGNQKLIAKLEVPLLAGGRYWFQVQKGEGKLHLKVLPLEDSGKGSTPSMPALLKQLNLAPSKENSEMLSFFIKEKLPLTRDTLQTASTLMKGMNQGQNELTALKEIVTRNLPLTKDVFMGILSNLKNEPLHALMRNLQTELASASPSKNHQQLSALIRDLVMTQEGKSSEKLVENLLKVWLQPQASKDSGTALGILQKLNLIDDKQESTLLQQAVSRIIAGESSLSLNTSEMERFKLAVDQGQGKLAELFLKQTLLGELGKADNQGSSVVRNILSLFSIDGKTPAMTGLERGQQAQQQQEMMLLSSLSQESEEGIVQWDKGKSITDHLRALAGKVGIDYESSILQFLRDDNRQDTGKMDVLKALLLKVMSEEPATSVREASEQLLNRITGIQLQSQESSPIQQYVMQVPIAFWNKTTDLTVQWSGRKKDNGQIDPDYCRVLFYLELEFLDEVIVDMQVQNRIMNLTIINDTDEIKLLSKGFIEDLKTNLSELGFSLSEITFQRTVNQMNNERSKNLKQTYESTQYTGVDIKI
jgi:hypothetical protein